MSRRQPKRLLSQRASLSWLYDGIQALARARGLQFLLGAQNPNGSWPAFSGDDQEGSGLTALAVIALINSGEMALQTERGLKWLLDSKGKESHWLWKWKFRTSDTHVRFDPDKFGWPWMPGYMQLGHPHGVFDDCAEASVCLLQDG